MVLRKITKITGNHVTIRKDDWERMWEILRPITALSANGCQEFCDFACQDNDGCDLSFGEEPECGALCNDGEVYLQEL